MFSWSFILSSRTKWCAVLMSPHWFPLLYIYFISKLIISANTCISQISEEQNWIIKLWKGFIWLCLLNSIHIYLITVSCFIQEGRCQYASCCQHNSLWEETLHCWANCTRNHWDHAGGHDVLWDCISSPRVTKMTVYGLGNRNPCIHTCHQTSYTEIISSLTSPMSDHTSEVLLWCHTSDQFGINEASLQIS